MVHVGLAGVRPRSGTIASTALGRSFPNPFRSTTSIEYALAERSETVAEIYDIAGRLVAGSGLYFYRLQGVNNVKPRKVEVLR